MANEYGGDFIVLTDEEGNEFELEQLDTLEYEGNEYRAFTPADPENEEELEIVIMMVEGVDDDGEEILVTLEDDDLLDRVYEMFVDRLDDEGDE